MNINLILIPLDERPVNTKYPQMLTAIGGAELQLPPVSLQGQQRLPADLPKLVDWLKQQCAIGVDAAIISCDYLAYGNLINARISDDSAAQVMTRVALLEELGKNIPLHVFSLITRVANSNDIVEEPEYWKEWGTKFYEFARLTHRLERAPNDDPAECQLDEERLKTLIESLPAELVSDWMTRRLRNHTVNLALVDMAARGKIASLLLTSDDTSAFGFPTCERDWIGSWIELIGGSATDNIRMHPGADEVGSALVAKLINQTNHADPKVWVRYAITGDEEIVAPYEDRPVRETVLGQIEACGCAIAANMDEADFVLGVVTPSPRRTDYRPEYLESDRIERETAYKVFLTELADLQRLGKTIALADVAYPNGSDPLFSELLLSRESSLNAGTLAAYGAWNTAGNTLGTVVAEASCTLYTNNDPSRVAAQQKFLTHRYLEDYGYQQRVRREARTFAESKWGQRDPDPDSAQQAAAVSQFIEARLVNVLEELKEVGVGIGLSIQPGSTRLPWRRTFEVDFDLV